MPDVEQVPACPVCGSSELDCEEGCSAVPSPEFRFGAEQHYTETDRRADPRKGLYPGLRQYRGKCSCGWIGRWLDYKFMADDDADDHVRIMAANA